MKTKGILALALLGILLSGCSIYKKYESKASVPDDAFGVGVSSSEDGSIAEMSWREFFKDPVLQELIDSVLARNTDLNSARLAVEKSEAALTAAKLGYLPSLGLSPQVGVGSFQGSEAALTYSLPLQLSWDIDLFGRNTTKKRKAEVLLKEAKIREEGVRANLISTVAQQYLLLLVLDCQLEILTVTDSLRSASLESQRAMWENGKIYSPAVNQMESSYLGVKSQIADVRRRILGTENAICRLLAVSPRTVKRNGWGDFSLPECIGIGVPASLLQYRPDVRLADLAMAEAYYDTQAARQAFYPDLTLSGLVGWANNAGSVIVNPGALLLNALGQLTQPVFARGKLIANKKIAQLTEKDIQQKYVQTVINAGNQVNEALADCQLALEKHEYFHRQVEVLQDAYTGTTQLMESAKASYLEVLTAQESLLSAQLNEAMNMYHGAQAVIALYIALGGSTK
ncbi:MAG: TolC family protein [Bacteroidales bacterium]|nr:TolC family protein [Bacteroidales bacterium]